MTIGLVPVTGEKTRSLDLTVPFARDSAKLTKAARLQLDELAAALSGEKLRGFRVEVYGHTDASGSAEYNLKLSKARASETVRYLVERGGLDRRRFRHRGIRRGAPAFRARPPLSAAPARRGRGGQRGFRSPGERRDALQRGRCREKRRRKRWKRHEAKGAGLRAVQ